METRLDAWILQEGASGAALRLIVPIMVFLALIVAAIVIRPSEAAEVLLRTGAVVLIGKIAASGISNDVWFWVFLLGTADVLVGLFILVNFDHLKRLPRFGYWIQGMEDTGVDICERQPWVRRISIVGIAIIVAIPIHGTGTITGSLMGRILGLGPTRTLLAVLLGSYPGVLLVLGGTGAAVALFRAHWALALVGLVALLVALYAGYLMVRGPSKRRDDA